VTPSLFDDDERTFDRGELARRMAKLAQQNILVGGSSWKYEGWLDQIYTRSRYLTRGRFSKKQFEEGCLEEYGEVYRTVCGDFAFYQFPSDDFWKRLFSQVPPSFQFAFKVPERITCKIFPVQTRYGAEAGRENPAFLDAKLLIEAFLAPLMPYRDKVGVLIFEFGTFARAAFPNVEQFLAVLDPFLDQLPPEFRYAVEIRNADFLEPMYFECLRGRGVAHVFNAWTRMPVLREQIAIPGSVTAGFLVARAQLRPGRTFAQAVEMFEPYAELKEPFPEVRESLRELIRLAERDNKTAFLFVSNRLEGNSPGSIVAITEDMG
jgi:uncharacterized protein YecE (DUF72 family)